MRPPYASSFARVCSKRSFLLRNIPERPEPEIEGRQLVAMVVSLLDLILGITPKRCPKKCGSWLCGVFFLPKLEKRAD